MASSGFSKYLCLRKLLAPRSILLTRTMGSIAANPASCPFEAAVRTPLDGLDPTVTIPEKYRHVTLSSSQRQLIKASIPALETHGVSITKGFYNNMLDSHKELREIFNNANQDHLNQPRALAGALVAYARNIDDLSPLGAAVELMAAKHVSLYVRPEQYAIVGIHLMESIGNVLGDAITPELAEAWTAAYWQLAEVLIKKENQLYQTAHGWLDWADFRIAKKVKESDEVTSFYLEPTDKTMKPLPKFRPGQFLSIQVDVPELGHKQTRQYSLSDQPNPEYYRISVKRELVPHGSCPAATPGLISNLMHDSKNEGDVIQVSHPSGDFFLRPESTAPLVLMSGGVGLTPLMSMLNALAAQRSTRRISWIHGARSAEVRAFASHVESLALSLEGLQIRLFDGTPSGAKVEASNDTTVHGLVDLAQLDTEKTLFLNDPATEYYVCGPVDFMTSIEKGLLQRGIEPSQIFMERFGTGGLQRLM